MMDRPPIAVGLSALGNPPLSALHQLMLAARLERLDAVLVWDHYQNLIPQSLWDRKYSWLATRTPSPHEFFEYQVLLGHLAARAGRLRLGVGVTEPIRRHPVLIAQAMMTLAHLTKRPPILGIGGGERANTEPYGLDFSALAGRLEEALQIIRLCFAARGPVNFRGQHFQLDGALMDLRPPPARTPEVWVAAHEPRMLRLAGRYGDGWYPIGQMAPDEYAAKLALIHAAAREAGRDPAAITPSLMAPVVVAPSERAARAMLRARAIRLSALLAPATFWRKFGMDHPLGERFRGGVDFVPEQYRKEALERALAAVPDDLVAASVIWGTPNQVIARLGAFGEAGMRHVVLLLTSAAISRPAAAYALLATHRIARVLGRGWAAGWIRW